MSGISRAARRGRRCVGRRVLARAAPPGAAEREHRDHEDDDHAIAQRGSSRRGSANGTCAMPGIAARCRSCSDLRSASRMNDISMTRREKRRAGHVEVRDHRDLSARADDPVDVEHSLALILAHACLEIGVVDFRRISGGSSPRSARASRAARALRRRSSRAPDPSRPRHRAARAAYDRRTSDTRARASGSLKVLPLAMTSAASWSSDATTTPCSVPRSSTSVRIAGQFKRRSSLSEPFV